MLWYSPAAIQAVLLLSFMFSSLPIVNSAVIESRDISPSLLSNFDLFSQYSAATYCAANDNGAVGSLIKCKSGNCPRVEATGATILLSFYNQKLTFVSGFLALDPANELIVLAFRGAAGTGFLTALFQYLTPCPGICANCKCHAGLYAAWLEARDIVLPSLTSALAQYPTYKLVTTGHSLGAAQSAYAAAELRKNGTDVTFYNFGQPRLGDINLSTFITAQGNNYRITHTDDPAPRMGEPSIGFRHISPEYWISHDAHPDFSVTADQITVLDGYNNFAGNAGTGGYDILAHSQYFQSNIGACSL